MMLKKLRYIFEYIGLAGLFFIFRILPVDSASSLGGWIGRSIGPCLAASRKADRNLRAALPDLPEERYAEIIRGMWENLGRVIAEYPHLEKIGRERVEIAGMEKVEVLRDDGQPGIFFTGHLGNWEIAASAGWIQAGLPLDVIYRAPNNPWTRQLLDKARSLRGHITAIAKSKTGAREMIRVLQDSRHLGILIDQKYNEGIPALFFGRPAMTSPAFVQLAQKFKCPLVPGRIERLDEARFRMTVYDPLPVFDENGTVRPVEDVIAEAHGMLEHWIRERPEQWLWLHRRWDSERLK